VEERKFDWGRPGGSVGGRGASEQQAKEEVLGEGKTGGGGEVKGTLWGVGGGNH